MVKQANVCFNCLSPSHRVLDCKRSLCKRCGKKHNTLLHVDYGSSNQATRSAANEQSPVDEGETDDPTTSQNQIASVSINMTQPQHRSYVLLPTAIVLIQDGYGVYQPCRALLDSGSQCTLIASSCVQRLGLKRTYDKTTFFGIGAGTGSNTKGKINIWVRGKNNNTVVSTVAFCLTQLTQNLPHQYIDDSKMEFFNKFDLADPSYNKPGQIEVLLGSDVFSDCILQQQVVHPSGTPTAISTIFGWVIMGKIEAAPQNKLLAGHVTIDLDSRLQQFWQIEELHDQFSHFTPEEEQAELHYKKHTTRDENGRYVVRLPLKNDELNIGESKPSAVNRLLAMERKFKINDGLRQDYTKFMSEYLSMGHMELVHDEPDQCCYLPHHAVVKPSSTTTKLRVVFDASCKSSNGQSLNDNLLVGGVIQNDLFDIMLNFRKYKVAFMGDIEKMYRQVLIHEDDRPMQRVVWRNSANEDIKEYNLKTVTYGTSAAPFLATRTLKQIAIDCKTKAPAASQAILDHFYVDDFMCCLPNTEEAMQLKNELCNVLTAAGLNLRKWASNCDVFLNNIPIDHQNNSNPVVDTNSLVSTLGLQWDTQNDTFRFSVPIIEKGIITKREILSTIARIFDPLGWIAPIVINLKIFMQRLWLASIKWDEELPADLYQQWRICQNNIKDISKIEVPRWIYYRNEINVELHGFSDASELAYAAVVYIKFHDDEGKFHSTMLAAKTRVAPVKQVSLPRLELCAAHLLVKLMKKVHIGLHMPQAQTYCWTDSTIVLAWLSDYPRRWKSFVANRTAQIIDYVPAQRWYHINSKNNPADVASRGTWPETLINNKLWWHGPSELESFTATQQTPIAKTHLEERKEKCIILATTTNTDIIQKFSNFTTLIRVTAYIYRFVYNSKNKINKRLGGLTTDELMSARNSLIKIAQKDMFAAELQLLKQGKQLPIKHKLAGMDPFIDDHGIMRVGGRIGNANINYDQKHPVILGHNHAFTTLVVRHNHIKHLHAGSRLLSYIIGLQYFIINSTYVLKQCIYKCTTCMRQRAKPFQQQMGVLPVHRLTPGAAFINTAVDFAGPMQIRSWRGRGTKSFKCWIAIFVCLATKAMHLEAVTELSTDAFIDCFRRFIARRGKPSHMFSDNGTNFMGANKYLRDLISFFKQSSVQESIARDLSEYSIQWHFSPPSGPHFGGLWEAGVKSTKYHLRRVLGMAVPTYEELQTILCQIEACLNSRPLCLKFQGDTDPLTPSHFLIMRPMTGLLDEDLSNITENLMSRWQRMQNLVQQFWKKWSTEYLHQLQQRPKWKQRLQNISINDVVLVKDDNLAPKNWNLAKVTELHAGKDGLVRVVTVTTAKGSYKRPITKLCPLFIDV